MGIVTQFLEELERGYIPQESASQILEKLRDKMTTEEKAAATVAIAKLGVAALSKRQLQRAIIDVIPDGFLQEYLEFTQISESPDSFHLFSMVTVMTHLVGRRVWFGLGLKDLYAPVSVFLVSPAGQGRRSTSILAAARIGTMAGASIVRDQSTPEGLVDALNVEGHKILFVGDEAASLLSKREYLQDMPQLLCTLLDNPISYQRKLKKEWVIVPEPTFNAIVGCAPEWIVTSLPKAALGGGLFSRMLVIYEARRKALIPLPHKVTDPELMKRREVQLANLLRTVTETIAGRMEYDSQAEELFVQFYHDNDDKMGTCPDSMAPYYSRKPDHVHRLVMTLLIANQTRNLVCNREILERVLLLLRLVENGMETAYRQAGLERPGQLQQRVMMALEKRGGRIERQDLTKRVSDIMHAKELDLVLDTLLRMGEVGETTDLVGGNRLQKTYYLMKGKRELR